MPAPADLVLYSNILKTLYPQSSVPELIYPDSPLLALLPKDESWEGEEYAVSNRYTASAGFSHTFSDAQDNKSTPAWARFRVTDTQDYALFSVPGRVLRATKGDKGALVRALKAGGDAAFYKMKRRLCGELYGNGGAAKGQIASGEGTDTLTLADINDVKNFEVGDILVSSVTDGTSGAVSTNAGEIGAIDRSTGELVVAGGGVWHADFEDDDFLFVEGDFGLGVAGVPGWIPAAAPVSGVDDWFGFDRGADPERQAGVRHTSTATTMQQALIDFGVALMRAGAAPTHLFVGPDVWGVLAGELQLQAQYERMNAQGPKGEVATVSFSAIKFMTSAGMLKILPDIDCPAATGFALKLDTWTLASRGALPGWLDDDGNKMLRESNADAVEGRIGYYGNLVCEAPGQNGRADFTTAL
jgi:hypothetical protein